MKQLISLLTLLFLTSNSATANKAEVITIYAYHSSPPFVINRDQQKGVNYDLVRALQKQAPEGIEYRYEFMSRPELNQRLAEDKPTIVLWANPAWFEKNGITKYLWSHPLYWDKDVIVSKKKYALSFEQTEDLKGLKLGGRSGYVYADFDQMIKEKKLTRIDSSSDIENIEKLLHETVDVIIISKASLLYYARNLSLYKEVEIIGKPYTNFKRHLLISKHYQHSIEPINNALDEIAKDKNWRFRLSIYGLQDLWLNQNSEQSPPKD